MPAEEALLVFWDWRRVKLYRVDVEATNVSVVSALMHLVLTDSAHLPDGTGILLAIISGLGKGVHTSSVKIPALKKIHY